MNRQTIEYDCPQCGEPAETLHEGYCRQCCEDNQTALDLHNAEYDQWQGMTQDQRDKAIKAAIHAGLTT